MSRAACTRGGFEFMTKEDERIAMRDFKEAADSFRRTMKGWAQDDAFASADPDQLRKFPLAILAEFQSKSTPGSAQHIAATFEFQRRLLKVQRMTAVMAGVMGILGALAGATLNFFFSHIK